MGGVSALWDGVREGCGSCEYWLASKESQYTNARGDVIVHKQGLCRRYPPKVVVMEPGKRREGLPPDFENVRPWTDHTEWCGEWKRKT